MPKLFSRTLNTFILLFVAVSVCVLPISTSTEELNSETRAYLANKSHLIIQSGDLHQRFNIELATTVAERAKGLMHRTEIADDYGMLFDFEKSDHVYMWMKNTYVSLDMLFVEEDGTIHHIVQNTTPLSESIIGSSGAVRYVLEVKGGTTKRLGINPGDRLLHQLFTPISAQ